jgi:hypothetical protein
MENLINRGYPLLACVTLRVPSHWHVKAPRSVVFGAARWIWRTVGEKYDGAIHSTDLQEVSNT